MNTKRNMSEINHEAFKMLTMLEKDCIYMEWSEKNKLERSLERILRWSVGGK